MAINVVTWNVTSLIKRERRAEMNETMKNTNADIVLLQETRLKPCHSLVMGKMRIFREDNKTGTAVAVNDRWNTERISATVKKTLECSAVRIKTKRGELTVISIYVNCNVKREDLRKDLHALLDECRESRNLIIGGDWNAHNPLWNETGDDRINAAGKAIEDVMDKDPEIRIHSSECNSFREQSNLDFFMLRGDISGEAVKIEAGWCHSPVLLRTNLRKNQLTERTKEERYILKCEDWEKLRINWTRALMDMNIDFKKTLNQEEIDDLIKETTKRILSTANDSLKKIKVHAKDLAPLPDEIRGLMERRRQAVKEKTKNRNRNPEWCALLKEIIKETSKQISKMIAKHNAEGLESRIKNIKTGTDMFKTIKRLKGTKPPCNNLVRDGKIINSPQEKAEWMGEHLQEIFKKQVFHNGMEIEETLKEVTLCKGVTIEEGNDMRNQKKQNQLTTAEEIAEIKKSLNNKKSSGEDGLSNYMLKKLPGFFCDITAYIANNCLSQGYFPTAWKKAIIFAIAKTERAKEPRDYRPISLLSNWSKILEEVIIRRIRREDQSIPGVPSCQFGFLRGHSTIDAIDLVQMEKNDAMREKESFSLCALDLSKAFDNVIAEGVIFKMKKAGIDNYICAITWSFMSNRSAKVKMEGATSKEFKIERGVPQGSKLGPMLFNIYTGDLRQDDDKRTGIVQYADDTILWTKSRVPSALVKKSEKAIRSVKDQLEKWGISINEGKTQRLVITNRGREKRHRIEEEYKKRNVVCQDKIKYLGVEIDKTGKHTSAIKRAARQGRAATAQLTWLLKNKYMDMKVKRQIYTTIIRPGMLYGSELWDTGKTDMQILEREERRIIRIITGLSRRSDGRYLSNKILYNELDLKDSISDVVARRRNRFQARRESHINEVYRERVMEIERKTAEKIRERNERLERIRRE